MEDWRGELLQAVERILDHEHSLLASAVRGREEEEEEEGENKPLPQKVRVVCNACEKKKIQPSFCNTPAAALFPVLHHSLQYNGWKYSARDVSLHFCNARLCWEDWEQNYM